MTAPRSESIVLEMSNVVTGYSNVPILDGVSLALRAGEILAIEGRNGTGKSTLLRLIAGLLPVWSGDIVLHGKSIAGCPPHEIRRRGVRLLMQGGRVFERLTVEDNLRLCCGRTVEIGQNQPLNGSQRASQLSGGERHQLAFAMAEVQEPTLLLLDEPVTGLSVQACEAILDRLIQQTRDQKVGVIIVEHRVTAISRLVDRRLLLQHRALTAI